MDSSPRECSKFPRALWGRRSVSSISSVWRISATKLLRCMNSGHKSKNISKVEWRASLPIWPASLDRMSQPNSFLTLALWPLFPNILLPQFRSLVQRRPSSELSRRRQKLLNMVCSIILPLSVALSAKTKEKYPAFWPTSVRWQPDLTTFWLM